MKEKIGSVSNAFLSVAFLTNISYTFRYHAMHCAQYQPKKIRLLNLFAVLHFAHKKYHFSCEELPAAQIWNLLLGFRLVIH
jgi:hypothetical protein